MTELKLAATLENLDQVQEFIGEQLTESGCPEKIRLQIEMAVEEIFVNIVTYAYAPEDGEVDITCSLTDSPIQIAIEFQDHGVPFDPLKQPEANTHQSAEEREIGGLGIFMTKQLMDNVAYRYEHGKNILTLRKEWCK